MISVTFVKENQLVLGIKTNKGILDVDAALLKFPEIAGVPRTVAELINKGNEVRELIAQLIQKAWNEDSLFYEEDSLEFGPCVPHPQKIICAGLNYKKHAMEIDQPFPPFPLLFSKCNNTLAGHKERVRLPITSSQVDYEAEIAIVIGTKAINVEKENALSYVYGYCNANDLSARDLQFATSQWLLGKTCDGFCPIGPYLVSQDEVGNPNDLRIRTFVNGHLRQDSNTSDMIFDCAELISYISAHMTLFPGDIILTGTPEGVIMGYPEEQRVWLQAGDEVSVEIERLGRLTNTFIANEKVSTDDKERGKR
ncbi:fumarylacetoacetate hydrolase family protein [Brevibacillus sp. SIMBA_040]|uniref:fumarylacetoacetate hydrolase family protein n=1 Tax=unclassified Brevibacillus TaxID=2684853 RepID=UPI00397BFBC5